MAVAAPPLGAALPTGAGAQAHLEAVHISAWFGTKKVLERVSLSMPPATVTALAPVKLLPAIAIVPPPAVLPDDGVTPEPDGQEAMA